MALLSSTRLVLSAPQRGGSKLQKPPQRLSSSNSGCHQSQGRRAIGISFTRRSTVVHVSASGSNENKSETLAAPRSAKTLWDNAEQLYQTGKQCTCKVSG